MDQAQLETLDTSSLDAHVEALQLQIDAVEAAQAVAEALPQLRATAQGMKQDLGASWSASDFIKVGKGENGSVDILLDLPDVSGVEGTELASRLTNAGMDVGQGLEGLARAFATDVDALAQTNNRVLKGLGRVKDALGTASEGAEAVDEVIGRFEAVSGMLEKALDGTLDDGELVDLFGDWVGLLGEVAVQASKAVPGMSETVGAFVETYAGAVKAMAPNIKQLAVQKDRLEHQLKLGDEAYGGERITSLDPKVAPKGPNLNLADDMLDGLRWELEQATRIRDARVLAEVAKLEALTQIEARQLREHALREVQRLDATHYVSDGRYKEAMDMGATARNSLLDLDDKLPADAADVPEWTSLRERAHARIAESAQIHQTRNTMLATSLPAAMAAAMAKNPHVYTPDKLARLGELGGEYAAAVRLVPKLAATTVAAGTSGAIGSAAAGGSGLPVPAVIGGMVVAVGAIAFFVGGGGSDDAPTPDPVAAASSEELDGEPTDAPSIAIGQDPVPLPWSDVAGLVASAGFGPPWVGQPARPDGIDRWVGDVENFPTDAGFEVPTDGQIQRAADAGVIATANAQWWIEGAVADRSDDDSYATVFAADVSTPEQAEALIEYAVERVLQTPNGADASTTEDGFQVVTWQYNLQQCPRGECFDQDPWQVWFVLFPVDRYAVVTSVQYPVSIDQGPGEAIAVAQALRPAT